MTKNNKLPKKSNPDELIVFKCRLEQFYADKFVHFKDDAARNKFNTFIMNNGGIEDIKVEVKVMSPAKKQKPVLLIE